METFLCVENPDESCVLIVLIIEKIRKWITMDHLLTTLTLSPLAAAVAVAGI